mmetsp:Transcript_50499/g.130086  ORF Transcript_50499/g.130086 Transcript_50499/m.130086 type:complete len:464 (+) Transcript_50499:183-1574(+)
MPIYEEKLICPFAIRFSQDHIRTMFRDGHLVEAALSKITTDPGVGDYDLILRCPFPNIEIIRWRPKHNATDSYFLSQGIKVDRQPDRWITLDNRRLYCLQKAAAALWPARVAAVIEIMYADSGSFSRKHDTRSYGMAVSLGHSTNHPVGYWCWRREVLPKEVKDLSRGVLTAVVADEEKKSIDELMDLPSKQGSVFSAFYSATSTAPGVTSPAASGGAASPSEREAAPPVSTSCGRENDPKVAASRSAFSSTNSDSNSTTATDWPPVAEGSSSTLCTGSSRSTLNGSPKLANSSAAHTAGPPATASVDSTSTNAASLESTDAELPKPASEEGCPPAPRPAPPAASAPVARAKFVPAALEQQLKGNWASDDGERIEVEPAEEAAWNMTVYSPSKSTERCRIRYDVLSDLVWWGESSDSTRWFFDAASVDESDGKTEIRWYAAGDWDNAKAVWCWFKVEAPRIFQ